MSELWFENFQKRAAYNYSRKVYQSKAWLNVREYVLNDNPLCTICEKLGKLVPAADVDHIIPLNEIFKDNLDRALAFNPNNLRGLCKKCHGEKSYTEGLSKHNKKKIDIIKPFKPLK